jgi:hypothetical protein
MQSQLEKDGVVVLAPNGSGVTYSFLSASHPHPRSPDLDLSSGTDLPVTPASVPRQVSSTPPLTPAGEHSLQAREGLSTT